MFKRQFNICILYINVEIAIFVLGKTICTHCVHDMMCLEKILE